MGWPWWDRESAGESVHVMVDVMDGKWASWSGAWLARWTGRETAVPSDDRLAVW